MSLKLGVLIPQNKKKKIKLPERISKLCEDNAIEVTDLCTVDDLYAKGPFDVLLHKVSDYYNECSPTDAALTIQKIKEYSRKFERMVLIDRFDESERLTDRIYQTKLIKSCEICLDGIQVFVPKTIEVPADCTLDDVRRIVLSENIKFPILVKPAIASITESSHDMTLIFTPDKLEDLKPPCLIQEFCNHSGIIYKIYVVGDHFNICERPSIKDVDCGSKETLYFDTRNVSKLGKTFLPDLHGCDPNRRKWRSCDDDPNILNQNVVGALCSLIRGLTNLHLLGIDILVEKETGNYALIDVNQFPGYSGNNENHFPTNLVKLIKKLGGGTS